MIGSPLSSHGVRMIAKVRSRREEIIQIASRLFVERGFQAVSTRAIAEAAGISQPTLYSHFSSKYSLLQEICVPWFHAMEMRLAEAMSGSDRGRIARDLCLAYIDFARGDPDHYYLALVMPNDMAAAGEIEPRFTAATRAAFDQIRRLAHLFEPDDLRAEVAAQSVWSALHGLVALLIWRPGFRWVDHETLISRHIEMIVQSLEGCGQASPASR
jgi:AcrR family transcriptional regulator